MDKKIKVLTISDHPYSPSGVGTQTKYMMEAALKTGRYKFICIGGAIKHNEYQPTKDPVWGEDLIVVPVDGYGTHDHIRSMLSQQKPDILWFMTDPRFYGWLWEIENEVRAHIPMVYYHVWDNYPYPKYNKVWYDSCDYVATISKVTDDIVRTVSEVPKVRHIPHAVNQEWFKPFDEEMMKDAEKHFYDSMPTMKDKVMFFWNNRNARRKQSGSLLYWFAEFAEKVGKENVGLLMHTNPKDSFGQDLHAIIMELGLNDGTVVFSSTPVESRVLAGLYNIVDCTINISDAEGFGLSTLESLACGTPIIVNMTGGLQEQVTDGKDWFGIGIEPSSKAVIGSQEVPYIYEDRLNGNDVVDALLKIYNMTKEERKELGLKGVEHVNKNYSFDMFEKNWVEFLDEIHEESGSWETRKNYKSWELRTL